MDFEKELKFYLDNKEELMKKYEGKVLVIKDEKIVNAFNSVSDAYNFGSTTYGLGNFSIQEVKKETDNTVLYHSTARILA